MYHSLVPLITHPPCIRYTLKQFKLTPNFNTSPKNTGGRILAFPTFKPAHLLGLSHTCRRLQRFELQLLPLLTNTWYNLHPSLQSPTSIQNGHIALWLTMNVVATSNEVSSTVTSHIKQSLRYALKCNTKKEKQQYQHLIICNNFHKN